jgi:DnaJ homolog subfamily A member 2
LGTLLPAKKADLVPQPEIVDEPFFEEADLAAVRARSFPADQDFFNQGFPQFGEDEDDWEDEDDEDDDYDNAEPECRQQ